MITIGTIEITTDIADEPFFRLLERITDINSLHGFINEQPVYPEWQEDIETMEFLRAVQGTVAIEGSELELNDVERIAEQETSSVSDKDKEAENALKAYEFLREWSLDNPNENITETVIKQIHTIMTRDINYYLNEPGQYRNQEVEFGYPRQKSVLKDRFEVEDAMSKIVDFINIKDYKRFGYSTFAITKALLAHYCITLIHPFIDGNGRVSRAVEALILHHYGNYEPYFFPGTARFYYKERTQYFQHLRAVDTTGNPYPFVSFAIDGLRQNLSEIKKSIMDKITETMILDYAHELRRRKKLLKRQTDLLNVMFYLEPMESDKFWRHPSIRALYDNLSPSTRKRDIFKLVDHHFVKFIDTSSPEGQKTTQITVNWDALRFVTLRLHRIPHRPQ